MDDAVNEMKGLMSRLKKFESNFKKCSNANRTKGYLEGRLSGIKELWKDICDTDATITAFKDKDNASHQYFEEDVFGSLEERYFQLLGVINEFLSAFNPQPIQNPNPNQSNNNEQRQENNSKVKLPKINLPSFSGSYHTWLSFKNRFTNLIHDNKILPNVEKLEYLKSCLTGDAERAIQRYQITDQNYLVAWNQLNEKYDNQRMLQVTQIETIIDRKEIRTESAKELRELLDIIQECLESLKNLGVDISTWDIMLIVLISRKLPLRSRELWEEELEPKEVPTYKQLCEFLEKRYRTLESLELIGGSESNKGGKLQHQNYNEKRNNLINQRTNCVACKAESHSLLVCETFLNMPLSNKSAFVNAKRICRNCLAVSHTLPDCKSSKSCFKCGRKHHTLLHREESSSSYINQNRYQQPQYPGNRVQSQTYVTNQFTRDSQNAQPTQSTQCNQNNQRIPPNNNQQQHRNSQLTKSEPANQNSRRALATVATQEQLVVNPDNRVVSKKTTLFPTAIIKVKSARGTIYNLRAMLDQCSDEAYIKESVAKMLGLKQNSIPSFDVTGLCDTIITSSISKAATFEVVVNQNESMEVEANIVKSLIAVLPKTEIAWPKELFRNITFADPNFATSGNVDVLLGSQQYTELILDGMLKNGGYLAQNTKLGWIISGKGNENDQSNRHPLCLITRTKSNADEMLKKFWEIEEPPKMRKYFTSEEEKCEEVFKKSYRRTSEGRVQVKLPFKENPAESLGASRNLAVARWLSMERKLERTPGLKKDYMQAMQEYLDLGHMTRAATTEKQHAVMNKKCELRYSCYYIPHHAVVREESKTTKTRIVFDASAKTSSKKSLNEILMVGPTIQESLLVRLMKWRCFQYALRGDITKMYRQIQVYEEDVNYQRLVFRFDKEDPIEDFQLNTLTFGTASAPFMAIRTLKELASDEAEKFPIGSKVVNSDFHVDDLLSGGDTIEEVKTIWRETTELLSTAKLPMRKWSSNNNNILEPIPEAEREIQGNEIQIDDSIKTLGIGWLPIADKFFFTVPQFDQQQQLTKRNFLSQVAKLFDPLGWLGPLIIKPKIMFQKLWKENLQWDDRISMNLAQEWISFRNQLHHIEEMRIPRWFGFTSKGYSIELHGFCDASIAAYGAVIYVKSSDSIGNSQIQIVLAKSRVAPVQTIRLPRLELCGAVLLANLVTMVGEELKISNIHCWTDSTITLDWIDSTPDLYKTFVANRVSEIQSLTNSKIWRHVDGKQNPADCLSRGLDPEELKGHGLWWHGPSWLKYPKERWPKNPNVRNPEDDIELKGKKVLATAAKKPNDVIQQLLQRYSSFQKLLRVTARIRTLALKNKPKSKILCLKEIEKERIFWIKNAQEASFSEEIKALKNQRSLPEKSKLLTFYPFLDSDGVLRIGGRLKEAVIDYDSKHQIIIPKESTIAKMIINDAHLNTKHGGTQLTMTYTRTQYWILSTRKTVRNHIKNCVICHRYKKETQQQLMGSLPEARVNLSRAFLHTGVDYAGPMEVLTMRKPGKRQTTKGWVALFVCLCTKAVHLELVSSLTSEDFLAAYTRFYSRRGLPSKMYSDNAKTFVGAKNELDRDYEFIKEKLEPELAEIMLTKNVKWEFIPPQAPHWGGLWEAGVKSMKYHLRRMMRESVHTFQEYTTMLAEIEACMNSRPLCPVSDDPDDLSVLTPAHFLIGDNLLCPPRPSLLDIHTSRLSKWKQISQKIEHFKKRWRAEYLSKLQYRNKWMRQCDNVRVGDMVLVKEDGAPPSKWLLGRIMETFPDEEGLVRSVKVKTETSMFMRPIHKVSVLPIEKALNDTIPN